jgi:hypothetical protein
MNTCYIKIRYIFVYVTLLKYVKVIVTFSTAHRSPPNECNVTMPHSGVFQSPVAVSVFVCIYVIIISDG